jgi:hypothetical protein
MLAQSQQASVSFVMSVRPYLSTRLWLDGFSWNLCWWLLSKCVEKIQICFSCNRNVGHITWSPQDVWLLPATWLGHKMVSATRCTSVSVVQWSSGQLRFSGNAFGICIVARTYGNTVYVNHTKNSMLRFPCNNGNANAPQCYAVCTLPLSFIWSFLYDTVCY